MTALTQKSIKLSPLPALWFLGLSTAEVDLKSSTVTRLPPFATGALEEAGFVAVFAVVASGCAVAVVAVADVDHLGLLPHLTISSLVVLIFFHTLPFQCWWSWWS